ncbi:MAG: VCBS repeat-containing protein, partial [Hyphomicrobiaceae bacterium]|nr:VCBS repeat-containing protein [Hyphomicrobiaceae bacterium]
SPLIINCIFRLNHADRGAAIFCDGGSPQVSECLFTENEGRSQAGGMAFFDSEAVVSDCTFTLNWGSMGSAVFLPDSSSVRLERCALTENFCAQDKGMIGVDGNSTLELDRTIVSFGNHHAVRCYDGGAITLVDCNVYGNANTDYSLDIITYKGKNGNINADPVFCDPAAGELGLRADSPCTDVNAWNGQLIGAHDVVCDAPTWFTDVSATIASTPARSGGASWIDINGDGNLDLFVANLWAANDIYLGDGAGGFTEMGNEIVEFPGPSIAGLWGDPDNDGDLDLYLSNMDMLNLLIANEAGVYEIRAVDELDHDGSAGGSAWLDFDNDGNLDLFIAGTDSTSVLLRNDGGGGFEVESSFGGISTRNVQQVVAADYDNDGDRDFYLVQYDSANQMIDNEGTFTDGTDSPLGNEDAGRSAAWGDFDNDGDLDIYIANADGPNQLLRNDNGVFSDVA